MVRTTSSIPSGRRRRLLARTLPFMLVLPLIVFSSIAYAITEGRSEGRLPVAQGASARSFHPIAGSFEADETTVADCGQDAQCLEQAFGNLSFFEGPRRALGAFRARIDTDPEVERDCHRIAHSIGAAALERFDGDVAATFARGSPTCVSGYYHGILDHAFLGVSSKEELAEVARGLCASDLARRRSFLDYQCRHGLGHGLMIQTGYDLPLVLSLCARLGTGWDHKACASGAFMENVDTRFGFRSPWLDDADPLYPCQRVHAFDRHSCYLRVSWRFLTSNGGDYADAARRCDELGRWATVCLRGLGRDAAEETRYAPDGILRRCALAARGESECLLGAARTIANAGGMPGIRPAVALCRHAPASGREACFSGVGIVLGMLHPTNASRRLACARVTAEHAEACTRAAIAEVDPSGRTAWG
jgi:hypothetical protein